MLRCRSFSKWLFKILNSVPIFFRKELSDRIGLTPSQQVPKVIEKYTKISVKQALATDYEDFCKKYLSKDGVTSKDYFQVVFSSCRFLKTIELRLWGP